MEVSLTREDEVLKKRALEVPSALACRIVGQRRFHRPPSRVAGAHGVTRRGEFECLADTRDADPVACRVRSAPSCQTERTRAKPCSQPAAASRRRSGFIWREDRLSRQLCSFAILSYRYRRALHEERLLMTATKACEQLRFGSGLDRVWLTEVGND